MRRLVAAVAGGLVAGAVAAATGTSPVVLGAASASTTHATLSGTGGVAGADTSVRCFGRAPTIVGTAGRDHLRGTSARDVVWAGRGDDVIEGLQDEDLACGGPGDDVVRGNGWAVRLDGGRGDDRVVAEDGSSLWGGPGADEIVILSGTARLRGGPGPDLLRAGARARRFPADWGPCVEYTDAVRRVVVNFALNRARGQGRDWLLGLTCVQGGRYDDVFLGSFRSETFDGMGGRNRITARGGRDTVNGGGRADVLELGPGNDSAYGGAGPDRIYGQRGDDVMVGVGGADRVSGGPGDDRVHAGLYCDPGSSSGLGTVDDAPNVLLGGIGDDYLTGDLGNDWLDGGPGVDRGTGGAEGDGVDVIISVETPTSC